MRLVTIDPKLYDDYKLDVIFNGYKWDPQVEDENTVSKYVLVITEKEKLELERLAQALTVETRNMQQAILEKTKLIKYLRLPKKIGKYLKRLKDYDSNKHVSLMRYDFHPTTKGFKISEVNSDVPGGLAEASILPVIARKYLDIGYSPYHVGSSLYEAILDKSKQFKNAAFVYATSYSDDRQVMQFLGDYFETKGVKSHYVGPEHLIFFDGGATDRLSYNMMDTIIRFYPLEWMDNLTRYNYEDYFNTKLPSCNHPVNILTQSKSLPLIWDKLGVDLTTWKSLLPKTVSSKLVLKDEVTYKDYIFKPILGRVGEGISIQEALKKDELKHIKKLVKKYPKLWIGQERFESIPVQADDGSAYHICLGVFTVDDKMSGFYGRMSKHPRIDSTAIDIPILVEKEGFV